MKYKLLKTNQQFNRYCRVAGGKGRKEEQEKVHRAESLLTLAKLRNSFRYYVSIKATPIFPH